MPKNEIDPFTDVEGASDKAKVTLMQRGKKWFAAYVDVAKSYITIDIITNSTHVTSTTHQVF